MFVPRLRCVPVTLTFLVALGAVAWVLHDLPPVDVLAFRARWSTDLYHLEHNPAALLGSIFICGNGSFLMTAPQAAVLLAPVEQLAGARRMLVLFFVAHLVAVLGTEFGGAVLHAAGLLSRMDVHRVDVGSSYGVFGVAAGLCYLLPGGVLRRLCAAAIVVVLLVQWGTDADVTSTGHLIALAVGGVLVRPVLGGARRQLYGARGVTPAGRGHAWQAADRRPWDGQIRRRHPPR